MKAFVVNISFKYYLDTIWRGKTITYIGQNMVHNHKGKYLIFKLLVQF